MKNSLLSLVVLALVFFAAFSEAQSDSSGNATDSSSNATNLGAGGSSSSNMLASPSSAPLAASSSSPPPPPEVVPHSLIDLIQSKATVVTNLAATADARFFGRCSDLSQCASGGMACTVPACGNTFSATKGFQCTNEFGVDTATCGVGVGGCGGLQRSKDHGVVRIAPNSDFAADGELQAFVCSSQRMDAEFKKSNLSAWQYIGSATGAIRMYPGAPQGRDTADTCSAYDPRIRPWYVAASTGPKDMVIVIDVSGSMSLDHSYFQPGFSRLDAVKVAVKALLDTLTPNDFVGIVKFSSSSSASPLVIDGMSSSAPHLMQATTANITKLKDQVDLLYATGLTYFVPGLEKAFEMFRNSPQHTSGCSRLMMFLTDGISSNSEAQVLSTITTEQATLTGGEVKLFTYSMSSGADDVLPRAMACNTGGIWAKITDGEDPLAEMSQYYQFLAASINSANVRWTSPYVDAFGMGEMVTAARAVYDRSHPTVPLLVGVVGTDVLMSDLRAFGDSGSQVLADLAASSSQCPTLTLSECQLQHLRDKAGYQCPAPAKSVATCQAGQELVLLNECTPTAGGLNSVFCESLDPTTRIASTSTPMTTAEVACCNDAPPCSPANVSSNSVRTGSSTSMSSSASSSSTTTSLGNGGSNSAQTTSLGNGGSNSAQGSSSNNKGGDFLSSEVNSACGVCASFACLVAFVVLLLL